ncbi:MAG: hypothetical protein WAR57_07870 [Candidatus Phosphoribacter sp.]
MAEPLRLRPGRPGPVQQDVNDCGPTALATARMLRDPELLQWIRTGEFAGRAFPAELGSSAARFAAYVELVHARTNGAVGPGGRLQVPWPRALGTSPWGFCRELEARGSAPESRYRWVVVRWCGPDVLRARLRQLASHVGDGRPAGLYVGSRWLPRHVALLVPDGQGGLLVHDPADGTVRALEVTELADHRPGIGGWTHAWMIAGPVGAPLANR